MLSRIFVIAWKELLQLRRDRRMLPLVIISPVLQLIIYGYAISTTVSNITIAVYDADRTPQSRELISSIGASEYFRIKYYVSDIHKVDSYIDRGSVSAAVIIPTNFGRLLQKRVTVPVQIILDGSDPNTAGISLGYFRAIFQRFSRPIVIQRLGRLPAAGINAQIRVWYNPSLESKNYMVPAIIALIMLQVTMNLTAIAIVKERERGTIEQLIVTPIRRHELILGKVLPYAGIGYLDIFLVLLVGTLVFKVPIQGSILLLLLLSGLFLMTALGTGLFISAISKNQQQATLAIG